MHLITETSEDKQQILIISKIQSHFTDTLSKFLEKYGYSVFRSPHLPPRYSHFHHIFYSITKKVPESITHMAIPITVLLFSPEATTLRKYQYPSTMKIVAIYGDEEIPAESFDKIIWFTFRAHREQILTLHHRHTIQLPEKPVISRRYHFIAHASALIRPRNIVIALIIGFFLIHIAFFLPMGIAYFRLYQGIKLLQEQQWDHVEASVQGAQSALQTSRSLYAIIRPTYLITGLARYPDSAFALHEASTTFISNAASTYQESKQLFTLLFSQYQSKSDKETINQLIDTLTNRLSSFQQQATIITQNMPTFHPALVKRKKQLQEFTAFSGSVSQLFPLLRELLAKDSEKTYVLLFANNMELRPGGGFIGSFAVVHIKNYVILPIQTYDVYDADGQLIAHIDPPAPIAQYLHQPHWFLRDSAFSPDFSENATQAKFFLSKTMKIDSIDGMALITTTAVQKLLQAVGPLYVPDYKETVNTDNFYIKAQVYAENNFFPGSIKKKQFLSAVFNQLLIQLQDFNNAQTALAIKSSLDEKQIVVTSTSDNISQYLDNQYWSGRMLPASCPPGKTNCIADYIFPVEANLGVNKANFSVRRSFSSDIDFSKDGIIRNRFTTLFINDSLRDVFPGGVYKNYYQVFLPPNSIVNRITKNNVLVDQFDQDITQYHRVGMYLEIKPQEKVEITVDYSLSTQIPKGKSIYQMIVQKQTGLPATDTNWTIHLPAHIYITNQNVTPLVKDNTISYNHVLTADTIFYFEVLRE